VLLSATDEDVLAAAESLAEALDESESSSTEAAFAATLLECNEAITRGIGVDYADCCGAGSDRC